MHEQDDHFSRKGAKAQSAAAFVKGFSLRLLRERSSCKARTRGGGAVVVIDTPLWANAYAPNCLR